MLPKYIIAYSFALKIIWLNFICSSICEIIVSLSGDYAEFLFSSSLLFNSCAVFKRLSYFYYSSNASNNCVFTYDEPSPFPITEFTGGNARVAQILGRTGNFFFFICSGSLRLLLYIEATTVDIELLVNEQGCK